MAKRSQFGIVEVLTDRPLQKQMKNPTPAIVNAPPAITTDVLKLCQKIGAATPTYLPIVPTPKAKLNECHWNTEEYVAANGGTVVYGWAIYQSVDGRWLEADFHSVVESKAGELLDVTPDVDGESRRLFGRETLGRRFDGHSLPKEFRVLVKDEAVHAATRRLREVSELLGKYPAGDEVSAADVDRIVKLKREAALALQLGVKPPSRQQRRQAEREARRR